MAGLKCRGGSLATDNQDRAVQGPTGIANRDATTGTAIESPKTVSSVAIPLVIPTSANWVTIRAEGADLRFGDNSTLDGTANDGYDLIPAGTARSIPCASGQTIYLIRDASTNVTAYFSFYWLQAN